VPWSEGDDNDPATTVQARVERLHQMLSTDPTTARPQIDAHLLAYHVSPRWPSPMLVLRREDTFHYHNLPDLSRFLRESVVSSHWSGSLVALFMSPFCLQVKRHVTRRAPATASTAQRCALLNLLHGLLLGLYPFNMQHATFDQRVRLAGRIRALLCSSPELQTRFLFEHEHLMTFAVAEYLANVLADFYPVECQLLVRSPQARYNVNQVCEAFRSAAMALGSPSWEQLDDLAKQQFPALQRQLKACNAKLGHCATPCVRIPTSVLATLAHQDFFSDVLMAMPLVPVAPCNMIAQINLLRPDLSFAEMQAVECFWNNVLIYPLPNLLREMQQERLAANGSCRRLQDAFTHLHVCLPCALATKTSILQQKFAFHCFSKEVDASRRVLCSSCSKPATKISLLGRLLRIRDTSYLLCPHCLRVTVWAGSLDRCAHCRPPPALAASLAQCAACNNKAVDVVHKVLDLQRLRLVPIPVCSRHAKHCILSHSTVYDIKMLVRDLHQH
jgi:hypothetical protein